MARSADESLWTLMYIRINDAIIIDASYQSSPSTLLKACGALTASLLKNAPAESIDTILSIDILAQKLYLPQNQRWAAELSCSAATGAIANYQRKR